MPLTREQAFDVIPPHDSFVRDYVLHAVSQGKESPLIYHVGVGLSILSATVPVDYGVRYAGTTLRANLYCILVGRSGDDAKSVAVARGREVLQAAARERSGRMPASMPGLFDSLGDQEQQIMFVSEWGAMLSPARKGYFEDVKTFLTDAFDCQPLSRAKAKNKDNEGYKSVIEKPRLSLLTGCSLPYLERYTLSEDWDGGFMGRFLVLYGKSDEVDPWPGVDMVRFPALVAALKARTEQKTCGQCLGPGEPGTPTRKRWDDWYKELKARVIPSNIAGVKQRAPVMALKTAMLLSWDYGAARGTDDWYIDMDTLNLAINMAELHLISIEHLAEVLSTHEDGRLMREVMSVVDKYNGEVTLQQVLSATKRKKRIVEEILSTLVEEGSLRYSRDPDGNSVYKKSR